MNARIQVEHPVTEAITGFDLVAEQIRGRRRPQSALPQDEIAFAGHAIECRLNAEDWTRGFRPQSWHDRQSDFPCRMRHPRRYPYRRRASRVPPFYDSLLAKIIVHGADRSEAIGRLKLALADCDIRGVATNRDMYLALLTQPEFIRGGVDTAYFSGFLEQREPSVVVRKSASFSRPALQADFRTKPH